jgi:large subunit ribosomal protein L9
MQVILLERHKKLGNVGDIATVKDGFARNFLIPNKKAMQTTKANLLIFEQKKELIHKETEKKQAHANELKDKINNKWAYILKQAGEDGRLYGSVNATELVAAIDEQLKEKLHRNSIQLLKPIKSMGSHDISVNVFADIFAKVHIMVARTKEEADLQIKEALNPTAANIFKEPTSEKESLEAESAPSIDEELGDDEDLGEVFSDE